MFDGLRVLMAMKVSLCGPHSLETSTLPPKAFGRAEVVLDWKKSGGLLARNWNLSHQVGFFESPTASAGNETSARARAILFIGVPSKLVMRRKTLVHEWSFVFTGGRPDRTPR